MDLISSSPSFERPLACCALGLNKQELHPAADTMDGGQQRDEAHGVHVADESPSGASGPRIKAYSPSKAAPGTAHSSSGGGTGPEDEHSSAAPADPPQVRLLLLPLSCVADHLLDCPCQELRRCIVGQGARLQITSADTLHWHKHGGNMRKYFDRMALLCANPDGAVSVCGEHRHREAAEGAGSSCGWGSTRGGSEQRCGGAAAAAARGRAAITDCASRDGQPDSDSGRRAGAGTAGTISRRG